jgi:hypothetical protein
MFTKYPQGRVSYQTQFPAIKYTVHPANIAQYLRLVRSTGSIFLPLYQ